MGSPDRPIMTYRVIAALWLTLLVAAIANNCFGWRLVGGYDKLAIGLLAIAGYCLFMFRPLGSIGAAWSVSLDAEIITTSDGRSAPRLLKIKDLRRVVIATDDSGPWGDDVVILLYSDAEDPVGVFPLEAVGSQDFIGWLAQLPGYREEAFAKAMGSTDVAHYEIFTAEAADPRS